MNFKSRSNNLELVNCLPRHLSHADQCAILTTQPQGPNMKSLGQVNDFILLNGITPPVREPFLESIYSLILAKNSFLETPYFLFGEILMGYI